MPFGRGKSGPAWPALQLAQIRKRARLVVVDDKEFPYLGLFRRDGYVMDYWPEVTNLSQLSDGAFDLILLDLHGVGTQESAHGGLGILQHLRSQQPTQIIIVYSAAEWSLADQQFFDLADYTLAKSADYVEFKQVVDDLLRTRFSFGFFEARLARELGTSADSTTASKALREAVEKNSPAPIEALANRLRLSPHILDRMLVITNVALETASLASRFVSHS
jgi:CheY-like chemotaxis protein